MSQKFLAATANKPPNILLTECMTLIQVKSGGNALDLGGGAGNDAIFLQKMGYRVDLIDKNATAAEYLAGSDIKFINASFEECVINENYYDFVNAQWAMSFCAPESFNDFWQKITLCLKSDGYFCGNFFGIKDDWSDHKNKTFFNSDSVALLFSNFEIIKHTEREWDGITAVGDKKHWHTLNYIAKKKAV
jgi:tellurite methyltransferase